MKMNSQADYGIVDALENANERWPASRRDAKNAVQAMKTYYTAEETSREDKIKQAKEDRETIKKLLEEHEDISTKAKNSSRNLKSQVQSSKNGVVRMRKYGLPAAIGCVFLGAIIGLAIGLKVPGVIGQAIAAVIGAIVGGFCCGCFAFVVYFVMTLRKKKKQRYWAKVESENEDGLALDSKIAPKRTCLGEIRNLQDDLRTGNYESTMPTLLEEIDIYMQDN